MIVEVSMT